MRQKNNKKNTTKVLLLQGNVCEYFETGTTNYNNHNNKQNQRHNIEIRNALRLTFTLLTSHEMK